MILIAYGVWRWQKGRFIRPRCTSPFGRMQKTAFSHPPVSNRHLTIHQFYTEFSFFSLTRAIHPVEKEKKKKIKYHRIDVAFRNVVSFISEEKKKGKEREREREKNFFSIDSTEKYTTEIANYFGIIRRIFQSTVT